MSEEKLIKVKMNNGDELRFVGEIENIGDFFTIITENSRFIALRDNIVWVIATDIEDLTT